MLRLMLPDQDVLKAYGLQANCYITKPVDFSRFKEAVDLLHSASVQVERAFVLLQDIIFIGSASIWLQLARHIACLDSIGQHSVALQPTMKKYLVFTYYVGRSLGGAKDYLDSFDTIEEALDNILAEHHRYYQVVDHDSLKTVKEGLAIFKNFVPENFESDGSLDSEK